MANALKKSDIKKGSALNLWYTINGKETCIAWATSQNFQSSSNLNEVNVKEAGDYPLQIANGITWNIQCDYLYSTADNIGWLLALHKSKVPVKITFCEVANYSVTDEKGIIGSTLDHYYWEKGNVIAEGNVIINDLTINSAAGDNASVSCTLTGDGQYTSAWVVDASGTVTGPDLRMATTVSGVATGLGE